MLSADYSRFPRAPLFGLTPIGLGTPMVESMESYVLRLAATHHISLKQLTFLIAEERCPHILKDKSSSWFRYDGISEVATNFAKSAAEFTMRPEVAFLGLQRFGGMTASVELIRQQHAWCPTCLYMWRRSGQEMYSPLLWKLAAVDACPLHRCLLSKQCTKCQKSITPNKLRGHPVDHCTHCGADLAATRRVIGGELHTGALTLARQVGELLSSPPIASSTGAPPCPDMVRVLAASLRKGWFDHYSDLAQAASVNKVTIYKYAKGGLPAFGALARISVVAGISLSGMFFADRWRELKLPPPTLRGQSLKPMRVHRKHDWVAIQEDAERALREGEPVSTSMLARRWGTSQKVLSRKLGTLKRPLDEQHAAYRVATYDSSLVVATEQIKIAMTAVEASGRFPSPGHVAKHLGQSQYTRLFTEAFARARVERLTPYEQRLAGMRALIAETAQGMKAEGTRPSVYLIGRKLKMRRKNPVFRVAIDQFQNDGGCLKLKPSKRKAGATSLG